MDGIMTEETKQRYNPQKHVCRFVLEQYGNVLTHKLRIEGNMKEEWLSITIQNNDGETILSYLYPISDRLSELLPLLEWADFEKYRDVSEWNLHHNWGYRDGWGYRFACISEAGPSMIQAEIVLTFSKRYAPPYAILLDWIIANYSSDRAFQKHSVIW